MNNLFPYSAFGSGLLLGGILSLSGAEPVQPSFPTRTAPTNAPAVIRPLPLTLSPLPYFQQPFTSMFQQRLSERAVDPLSPITLQSATINPAAYESFNQLGKSIVEGAARQTVRDWMVGRVLPTLSLYDKPLTEVGNGFILGSIQGMQRRDLEPLTSVYRLEQDTIFRPQELNPLAYTWGIDPFRLDPKIHATLATRDATRVFRLNTSHKAGELSFDVHDTLAFVRLGVRSEYTDFNNSSSAFISVTPRYRLPLNLSFGSNMKGDVTASAGLHFRF